MRLNKCLAALPLLAMLAACAAGGGRGPVVQEKPAPPLPTDDTRLLALSVGAMAGSQLGGNVGRQMTRDDRAQMQAATQRALESGINGEAAHWNNTTSGHSGSTTPQGRFTTAGGASCREFQQSVNVDGQNATAYGTACRQPDGRWTVVSG